MILPKNHLIFVTAFSSTATGQKGKNSMLAPAMPGVALHAVRGL
jgi:hypothetical protein